MAARKKSLDFETSLEELESLVTQMETGELSLEEALKAFEQGVKLTRECQTALQQAEQKVEKLSLEHRLDAADTTAAETLDEDTDAP